MKSRNAAKNAKDLPTRIAGSGDAEANSKKMPTLDEVRQLATWMATWMPGCRRTANSGKSTGATLGPRNRNETNVRAGFDESRKSRFLKS